MMAFMIANGYRYIDFGYELHGRNSFRLWVNAGVPEEDGKIRVIGKDRKIIKTKNGNYVLVVEEGHNVFNIGRHCGYRGGSSFEIKQGTTDLIVPYEIWDSERGSLGVSEYALVVTKEELIVKESASGRLYGDEPEKWFKYTATFDGQEKEQIPPCLDDDELCEIIKKDHR